MNPFTYNAAAFNFYKKALVEITPASAASAASAASPKILIYAATASIAAAIIYKSMKWSFTPTSFLSRVSTIFHTNNTPEPPPEIIAFEDKYFKEYDKWKCTQEPETNEEHKKECLENMYYSTVRETINDFYGDVIMCYDHKTLSFAYYARTGSIPYKYLETISRKYMIETNAPRDIHVDIRSEYNKAKNAATAPPTPAATATATATAPATATDDHAITDTDDHEDTVFVKLKSYNTASNLKIHTHTNDKTTTEEKQNNNHKSNVIIRENANRYSYRGKITDFEEHHKTFLAERRTRLETATKQTHQPISPTGYSEYKKRIMRSAL
jgi:hypothetical protein